MSSSTIYDEQGRAKRAGRGVYIFFGLLSLILACAAGSLLFIKYTLPNLSPLQRVYYFQFKHSFFASFSPFAANGQYLTFTRVVTDPRTKKPTGYWCTEDQMTPRLDEDGFVQFENGVPQFALNQDVPVDQGKFYFGKNLFPHRSMYEFFKNSVYESSYPELFTMPAMMSLFVFGFSFGGMSLARKRFIVRKMRGKFERGKRLLSPAQYSHEMKSADGIGIDVIFFNE